MYTYTEARRLFDPLHPYCTLVHYCTFVHYRLLDVKILGVKLLDVEILGVKMNVLMSR